MWLVHSDKGYLPGKEFERELTAKSYGVTVETSVLSSLPLLPTLLSFYSTTLLRKPASIASRCPGKLILEFHGRKEFHLLVYLKNEFSPAILPSDGRSHSWEFTIQRLGRSVR